MSKNFVTAFCICLLTFVTCYVVDTTFLNKQEEQVIQQPTFPPNTNPLIQPQRELTLDEALNEIKQEELKEWLYHLASNELEGRMSGKQGHFKAADFVENKCKEWGLETRRHRFNIRQLNPGPQNESGEKWTENVYAEIQGIDSEVGYEIVVVGSHLDHIGYGPSMARDRRIAIHPGADDNASGSVATLALAKAFSKMAKPKRTILFQWYSAEEMGLIGSKVYVQSVRDKIKDHVAMVNSDMIGRLGSGRYSIGWSDGNSSMDLKRLVSELNPKYSFAKQITSHGSGGSDHANFYNVGVPVAFLHTGLHNDYHRTTDTVDKINYEGLERVIKYEFELVYKIVSAESRPRFNYADFKPMSVTHDHGHNDVRFIHPWHVHEWERLNKQEK